MFCVALLFTLKSLHFLPSNLFTGWSQFFTWNSNLRSENVNLFITSHIANHQLAASSFWTWFLQFHRTFFSMQGVTDTLYYYEEVLKTKPQWIFFLLKDKQLLKKRVQQRNCGREIMQNTCCVRMENYHKDVKEPVKRNLWLMFAHSVGVKDSCFIRFGEKQ